ncbi:hypothetical protein [Jiangella mangrovi]|uniref:Uncharacterized protein n=1 Tax=Jiangella mangrovi TaxID=1524084 RepID=A0A7W9GLI8_9ACTN|nr:hypothetical protein [Jiangella mangrovi]MBB5785985.1 hypothetical protein [Jiangella mangrovi]
MTALEEYVTRIDAFWRRPIRGRDFEFWMALYTENTARTTAVTAVVE